MGQLSPSLDWELANPKWAATLNPLLANPLVGGRLINGIRLAVGDNIINHGLGAKLQGYIVVGSSAAATFYDKQATNQMPSLTLVLVSSAVTTINLYVF
jgi:hypothetical protein